MNIIRINVNGSMNDIKVKSTKNLLMNLKKISNNSGLDKINELYVWNYDNKDIKAFGWINGDEGYENKHKLIPAGNSKFLDQNSEDITVYGDIFICAFVKDKLNNFNVSDYALLNDIMNDSEQSESEDSEYEIVDNENNFNESDNDDDYDYEYNNEELLNIDDSDYNI